MDIYSKILSILASGEKTCSELATALKLSSPKVSGALVSLVAAEKVIAAGKTWLKGKEVTVYAVANKPAAKAAKVQPSYKVLTNEAIAKLKAPTKLYQIWGGYAPLDIPPSKELASVQHTQN